MRKTQGLTYDEIKLGDGGKFSKTITEADIFAFAGITGDFNPAHMDDEYMRTSRLGQKMQGRIAHGMLVAGFFSTLVGEYIPGKGALYISQTCNFKKPVKIGDTITAIGEVVEKMEKNQVRIRTQVFNQRGELVTDGEAIATAATRLEDVA